MLQELPYLACGVNSYIHHRLNVSEVKVMNHAPNGLLDEDGMIIFFVPLDNPDMRPQESVFFLKLV